MKKLITVVFALLVLTLPLCALADDSSVSTPNISVTTTTGSATFTLKSDSTKATIYYTTDGSDPTTYSKKYTKSVKITSSCEVRAIAVESGEYSDVGYYTVTVTKARAATPVFKSTNVDGGKKITITSSGATIYYTTDGSTPTTNSYKYTTSGIIVSESCYIKAIAVRSGYSNSAVAGATVKIDKIGKPTVSKTTSGSKTTYKLSGPLSGCTYYYTTDGSEPEPKTSSSCKKSTGSITITQACTLKFIACKAGYAPSNVYTVTVAGPELSAPTPTKTEILGGYKITLKSPDSATMYYTTDGSIPTILSSKYTTSGITVTERGVTTIRVLVTKSGYGDKIYEFSVTLSKLAKPSASVGTSTSSSKQTIVLNGPSGSTIYYTTNGTDPTTSSKSVKAGGTITITSSCTLKLMAAEKGYANSDIYTATIKINGGSSSTKVADPTVSETKYTDYNRVTLKCSTSGATIYYTLDGSNPLIYGTAVKSGTSITIDHSCQLKAVAVKEGLTNSNTISYNVILKNDNVTPLGLGIGSSDDPMFPISDGDIDASQITDSFTEETDGITIISDDSDDDSDPYIPHSKDEEELEIRVIGGSYDDVYDGEVELEGEDAPETSFDPSLYGDDVDNVVIL